MTTCTDRPLDQTEPKDRQLAGRAGNDDVKFGKTSGNVFETNSTVKTMTVNTCAACHPYFTGQQTFIDTEGRIDSFKRRYAAKQAKAN